MWKLMGRYVGAGIDELYRSMFTSAQVKLLQKYVPELRLEDVERSVNLGSSIHFWSKIYTKF